MSDDQVIADFTLELPKNHRLVKVVGARTKRLSEKDFTVGEMREITQRLLQDPEFLNAFNEFIRLRELPTPESRSELDENDEKMDENLIITRSKIMKEVWSFRKKYWVSDSMIEDVLTKYIMFVLIRQRRDEP